MIQFFDKNEIEQTKKQRSKCLTIFFVSLFVYVLISVAVLIWYTTLPYEADEIFFAKLIEFVLTAFFILYAFVYLNIAYKRVNAYYKLCKNMETGLKETYEGNFFEYDETVNTKDGVEVRSLVFLQWNQFKGDYFERKVFVLLNSEFPQFNPNQKVRYTTQGNVLYSYEIIEE